MDASKRTEVKWNQTNTGSGKDAGVIDDEDNAKNISASQQRKQHVDTPQDSTAITQQKMNRSFQ
jgi:hypothetical protein